MNQTSNDEAKPDVLQHHYEQVCQSFHAIDDFRGRLLALWPILGGAAGGIALLASDKLRNEYLLPLGIFGVAVSIGVGIYEWTQTLRCVQLKEVARRLEEDMNLKEKQTQFNSIYDSYSLRHLKPTEGKLIRTGLASAIVYGSVIVGWIYIVGLGLGPE